MEGGDLLPLQEDAINRASTVTPSLRQQPLNSPPASSRAFSTALIRLRPSAGVSGRVLRHPLCVGSIWLLMKTGISIKEI